MALAGSAALAMWWDMAPAMRAEFEHWHTHEHFPERLALPGFLRGSRWGSADGGDGFFILYETDTLDALTSPEYLARLNAPTPWSTQLMPHHRNMVRTLCNVVASHGAGVAGHACTVRFTVAADREAQVQAPLAAKLALLAMQAGVAGAHLLRSGVAAPKTAEQAIRGNADQAADWIVLVTGYDLEAVRQAAAALVREPGAVVQLHSLALSMAAGDTR
ncbi:DUF4286 family protein [Ramlibacter algicola]|uniref:Uncharacterized protein n=1 Tax=Ramlibacter algicola TaxID=2795217 RepID=A0A934URK8_9BURK|nr:DUF4286 family protein [Ramlibacter algicola]MBK0392798.1 hypothetical protein [Ramlibacter algicola]